VIPRIACTLVVSLLTLHVSPSAAAAPDVVGFAARLIGRPYVWGAEGPDAFDCSGLMQYIHRKAGITLPRRAISQSKVGVRTGSRLQRGDLLFFSTDTRRSEVTHVGIYEGTGTMIEASKRHGRVRRDRLDDDYWVERFMFARRLEPGAGVDDDPEPRAGRAPGTRRPKAIRVLETIADVLIGRPDRR
jgi:cell wall-associated NlpC family hydrolase